MAYHAVWEERGIYVSYSGQTSDVEIAKFAEEGQADERFTNLRYVLHDFTKCSGATYSDGCIQELAAIDSAASTSNSRIKIAVITDEPVRNFVCEA